MKAYILLALLALAAGIAVSLVFSALNVARETIDPKDLPEGPFETIKWVSDAGATAFIMNDPTGQRPVTVSKGLGKTESVELRPSREYFKTIRGQVRIQRVINKKTGQPFAYILASEGLEMQAGFSILNRHVTVSISDPEDSHHKKQREGP